MAVKICLSIKLLFICFLLISFLKPEIECRPSSNHEVEFVQGGEKKIFGGILDKAKAATLKGKEEMKKIAEKSKEKAKAIGEKAKEKAKALGEKAKAISEKTKEEVKKIGEEAKQKTKEIANKGMKTAKEIAQKVFGKKIGNNVAQKMLAKPKAIAGKVFGKENNEYCAKTNSEKEKALDEEQRKDLHEGDLVLSEKLKKLIDEASKKAEGRDVLSFESMRWPTKVIPYVFDPALNDRAKAAALAAFKDFATYTCVRFVPRTSEANYIRYFPGSGCYSYVGKNGGAQDLSIGSGCEYKGTIIHESMHAMGFFHEHTRLDRDNYVKINFNNIRAGMEGNFKKYLVGQADYLGEPYDYNSIMHYPENAFANAAGTKTIELIAGVTAKIGQRDGLSEIDIKQIRKLFKCSDPVTTVAPVTTAAPTTVAPTTAAPTTIVPATTVPPVTTLPPAVTLPQTTAMPGLTVPPKVTTIDKIQPVTTTAPIKVTLSPKPTTVLTQAPLITNPAPTPSSIPQATGKPAILQTTQPIMLTPIMGNGQKILIRIKTGSTATIYPQWPTDFNWNTQGQPQNCGCHACGCQCVHVNEPSAGIEWKNNYLCYKKRDEVQPGIEWSHNGEIEGKRCTHISDPTFGKYWQNNFLCVPKDSPYHFVWSFRGPVKSKDLACLRMGIPDGPAEWTDNYLCAKKTELKKPEEL